MCQERLTGLALVSVERDVRRALDMEDIVVSFAKAKAHTHQLCIFYAVDGEHVPLRLETACAAPIMLELHML